MAGNELYRIEIPIIVDDQTEIPLQQAGERTSRFERRVRRDMEQTRQHLLQVARTQIEPIMRVRDQLTSGVLKADRLISKLDASQASPLITAQDRISSVVVRVNAMLNALDKGKVDVVADMKGPLLDEIVKAKSALAVLNNVKAGPVAELRGELFGQLSRAMSQIRGLDLSRAEPQATLRERVTIKVREIGSSLRSLTARAWNITLQVKDKVTGFFGRIGRMLTTPLGMIGMGGITLGPMALIGNAIKTAGEFEQAMANVQSVAGASREEMASLREAAAKAGRETVFKASEAADALYYLALAGFNVNQQIGALSGTLALAAATQSDLAFTSETVASTISAFGLPAEEADRVANVFAATISSSQASMDKLANSMRYAGPAAAGFGRSLEETAATLALFYNMGLTGEMAGTRFRTALSALAHPTGDTKKALAELGIKASQVNPAMHSLADIIDLLKDKGVDTAMAMRIFGQETGPAMASLIALGGNALKDMERQITGTNKALEMQEIQLDTLTGAQKELQSVWEAINITLGTQSIPGLRRLVEWFKQAIGNSEELAKSIGDKLNRAFEWLADILESPEFREATFADKIKILFTAAIDEITAWLGSSGKEQLSKVFVTLGEASVKAYITGMKALGQRAIQELKQGNVAGAAVPAAAMWMLGGGTLLRGAWGLGKGAFGVGKWALGKLGLGTAGTAGTAAAATLETTAATAATGAATTGAVGILGKSLFTGGILAGAAGIISGAYDIYRGTKETDPEEARKRYWAGGTKIGMVATGAAIGTAIAPGIGTAVGAGIGGVAALLGGEALGETLRNVWDGFLSWGSEAWDTVATWASNTWDDITTWASGTWENVTTWASGTWEKVKESASNAWNWIKENFTLESIAEKAGYVVGYLESTLFSGEWWLEKWDNVKSWASEKWASMVEVYESAKATIMSTIFSSEWWLEKWDNVKSWASEKWAAMSEVWENTKEILNSTIFNSEWWQEKWSNVKSWTSEKWDKMKTVWETVKSNISSTLFSKTWWESKWENVKTWASGVLDNITARWESIKESFQAGREAGREAGQRAAATKHAIGGILTRPHLGLVAEAGPEAIIPLSYKMRNRALDLWQKVGTMLGVMPELPKLTGQAVINPVLGLTPRVPQLIGDVAYKASIIAPRSQKIFGSAVIESSFGFLPRLSELTGQAVITGNKDISENIQYVTRVSETGKRFANVVEMKQYRNLERLKNDIHDNIQQTTEAIETTRRLTNVIDIEQYRNLKTRNNTINENEAQFVTTENKIQTVKAYATGGILTKPHIGLVAEAGPEVIIPLSTRMRARALELYEKTGRMLGVEPYAEGGLVGSVPVVVDAIGQLFGGVGATPGAVIGGILGGIGGFFGGEMIAEKINAWLDKVDFKALKEKVLLMRNDVGQKASEAWDTLRQKAGRQDVRRSVTAAHAYGGILTRPHLGMVAEAGPEAIIPLSARMRARALALYEETGKRLGVRPYADGGFAGVIPESQEQKIPVSFTPSLSLATPGPTTVNLNFDLTGLVRQVVIENREDIDGAVDKITDAIANNLRSVFQNMTK